MFFGLEGTLDMTWFQHSQHIWAVIHSVLKKLSGPSLTFVQVFALFPGTTLES